MILISIIPDHVALLWTGATDFGQDGYWTWSQSKKPVKVTKMEKFSTFEPIVNWKCLLLL